MGANKNNDCSNDMAELANYFRWVERTPWKARKLFFLLLCCAHHDDGDSLGMNDDLVHQMLKKGEYQSPDKNNKNRPTHNQHTNKKQTNKNKAKNW